MIVTQPRQKVSDLLQLALSRHQVGALDEARQLYERVLRVRPKDHVALHCLGLVLCSTGESKRGIQLIRRAIALFPKYSEALCNLGCALQGLGRNEEALAAFDKALSITPDNVKALSDRAGALHNLGRFQEALDGFDKALSIKPEFGEALNHRGTALQKLNRLDEAIASFDKAVAIKPDFAEALINRGTALLELNRIEEAVVSFDQGLADKPDFKALNNRGVALQTLGRFEEALASFDAALTIKPDYVSTLINRGGVLQSLGRLEDALISFEKALAIEPDHSGAHWNESLCRLKGGDFQRGWEKYEWRWRLPHLKAEKQNFPVPLWSGKEEISGKAVLLHPEGGFGDTLQFCRYVPKIAARGATVILVVQAPLNPLLRSLAGLAHFLSLGDPLPHFDFHCPLMSLPLALDTRVETIPADIPYLSVDPGRAAQWRQRLEKFSGPKVGVVWSGKSRPDPTAFGWIERRSMRLEQMADIFAVNGVTFVSLQKGEPAGQPRTLRAGLQLVDWTDELTDFSDTAALVEALDLVISVDTSVAHLAGALGKPVWLLNRFDTEWRWLLNRDDSPWYPTMRLFTQPSPGDWASVMAQVTLELRSLAGSTRPSAANGGLLRLKGSAPSQRGLGPT